jgi:hypothetical protein
VLLAMAGWIEVSIESGGGLSRARNQETEHRKTVWRAEV